MVTYEPADLLQLKSEVRELRALMNEGFRTSNAGIDAIKETLREEQRSKRLKELENWTALAALMWIIGGVAMGAMFAIILAKVLTPVLR